MLKRLTCSYRELWPRLLISRPNLEPLSFSPFLSFLFSFDRPDEEAITGAGQQKLDELAQNMQEQQQRKSTAQEEEVVNPRKEKSVLQTKLTKLAIQIGYGGAFEPTLMRSNQSHLLTLSLSLRLPARLQVPLSPFLPYLFW